MVCWDKTGGGEERYLITPEHFFVKNKAEKLSVGTLEDESKIRCERKQLRGPPKKKKMIPSEGGEQKVVSSDRTKKPLVSKAKETILHTGMVKNMYPFRCGVWFTDSGVQKPNPGGAVDQK